MTYKIPFDATRKYDYMFDKVINKIKNICQEETEDDDALILAFGETGSGKTNLFLWFMHQYLNEERNIKYVALTRGGFTKALKSLKYKEHPKLLLYDEANLSKREGLAKWNKQMIDTYFSIRGKNICHLWCNPSIDYLDKEFIEERIKRVFLIVKPKTKKDKAKQFRYYYYFDIDQILDIYEKYGNLKFKTIYKVRKKYSMYRGWFKRYDGDKKLLEEYNKLKHSRMDDKIDKLNEDFGDDEPQKLNMNQVARKLKCNDITVRKYIRLLMAKGLFVKGTHYDITPLGRYEIEQEYIPLIQETILKRGIK